MSGFVKGFRGAMRTGEGALKELFETNVVSKSLKDLTQDINLTKIGDLPTEEFSHAIRSGEITTAFTEASPKMTEVLSNNKNIVQIMEREALDLPEGVLESSAKETAEIQRRLPDIEKVTNAAELENEIGKDTEIKNKVEEIDRNTEKDSNGYKKYVFLGLAILGAITIYEAIEAYAKSKSGCFVYTKKASSMATCKVLNLSCLNSNPDDNVPTCVADDVTSNVLNTSCDDWSENNDGACYKCSYKDWETDLKDNQSMECIEKPSFGRALGDLFIGYGTSLLGGIGDLIKTIIKYALLLGLIVAIIWVGIKAFGWITSSISNSRRKNKEKEIQDDQDEYNEPTKPKNLRKRTLNDNQSYNLKKPKIQPYQDYNDDTTDYDLQYDTGVMSVRKIPSAPPLEQQQQQQPQQPYTTELYKEIQSLKDSISNQQREAQLNHYNDLKMQKLFENVLQQQQQPIIPQTVYATQQPVSQIAAPSVQPALIQSNIPIQNTTAAQPIIQYRQPQKPLTTITGPVVGY